MSMVCCNNCGESKDTDFEEDFLVLDISYCEECYSNIKNEAEDKDKQNEQYKQRIHQTYTI